MADYYSPTVIQPEIPISEMTACERLVLTAIFDHQIEADSVYFFAETGANTLPEFDAAEVREALSADEGLPSYAAELLSKALSEAADGAETIDIDMSITSFEFIFQDIVRRSVKLDYVTAVSSYVCSKMRPDGFGGWAVLITADQILGKSTDDIINDVLDEVDPHHQFADRRAATDGAA